MKKEKPNIFTLLELLVVVAVMVILMSLLLPGLRSAKETGKRIACGSNLKQLGVALTLYSTDFNFYPPPLDAALRWWCRDDVLGSYFGYFKQGGGIMRCPNHPVIPYNHCISNFTMNCFTREIVPTKVAQPSRAILLGDSLYADTIQFQLATYDRVVPRHSGRVNCLFVDGHVDALKGFFPDNVTQGWR